MERGLSRKQTAIIEQTTKGTVRPHQPGESAFKAILTEDIDWKPFAAFPPSVRLAVVVGQPSEPGPYVIRVRVPRGVKLMAAQAPRGPHLYRHVWRLLHRSWRRIRCQQTGGLSARNGDHSPREYMALPLGEIRRVRHADISDRSAWPGIRQFERRSAESEFRIAVLNQILSTMIISKIETFPLRNSLQTGNPSCSLSLGR